MNLTQERINEIALEVAHRTAKTYRHKAEEPYGFDEDCMIHAFNRFLSRLREEQEPALMMNPVHNTEAYNPDGQSNGFDTPLFTIPPASAPKEYNCSKLVEALEIIYKWDSVIEIPTSVGSDSVFNFYRNIAGAALAKHKASMGEK